MWFFKLKENEADRARRYEGRHSDHASSFSYIFTVQNNTSNFICRIKCNGCGKSENITDFGEAQR